MTTQQLPAHEAAALAPGEVPAGPIRLKRRVLPDLEIEAKGGEVVTYATRTPSTDELVETQRSLDRMRRIRDIGELREAVGACLGFFLEDPDGFLEVEEPRMAQEALAQLVERYVGSQAPQEG